MVRAQRVFISHTSDLASFPPGQSFFDAAQEQWDRDQNGALVEEVKSGSWAELGSLYSGDLVVEINGHGIGNPESHGHADRDRHRDRHANLGRRIHAPRRNPDLPPVPRERCPGDVRHSIQLAARALGTSEEPVAIAALRPAARPAPRGELAVDAGAIAIVGIGCRFPGASGADTIDPRIGQAGRSRAPAARSARR